MWVEFIGEVEGREDIFGYDFGKGFANKNKKLISYMNYLFSHTISIIGHP